MPTLTKSQILTRSGNPHVPSLENRVAYQCEQPLDTVGFRSVTQKDQTVLRWLRTSMSEKSTAFLDVGCAYGNFALMLNALMGKPQQTEFHGVDLYAEGLKFAQDFAQTVPDYSNCKYQTADITGSLPFPDNYFDAVHMGDVIEHLEDPLHAVRELSRVAKSSGTIVITTPLKDGLFKKLAAGINWLAGGRLYQSYYKGKCAELDSENKPIMDVHAGHDHISEMTLPELTALFRKSGLIIEEVKLGPIMSGSAWFDKSAFLLSMIFFLEGVHEFCNFPSWAHSVSFRLRKP